MSCCNNSSFEKFEDFERQGKPMDCNDHPGDISEFKNKAELLVCCDGRTVKVESNTVEAKKLDIKIKKFEDKKCVIAGDTITYTCIIKNDSHMMLDNVQFVDHFSKGLKYEPGTFKVNGHEKHPTVKGNDIFYDIKNFEKGEIEIAFKCKVL